jgi:hypothetical protein
MIGYKSVKNLAFIERDRGLTPVRRQFSESGPVAAGCSLRGSVTRHNADGAAGYDSPIHARTGVGARVPSLDFPILRPGFPSVETILRKIQQKHGHIAWLWNATVTSDICISVTLLREAARQEI